VLCESEREKTNNQIVTSKVAKGGLTSYQGTGGQKGDPLNSYRRRGKKHAREFRRKGGMGGGPPKEGELKG